MTARDEQGDGRGLERLACAVRGAVPTGAAEQVRAHVPDEVVHGVQRLAEGEGEGLGRPDADHEGAGETGAARDGDGIQFVQRDVRLGECRVQGRHERLEVRARRDLGHDTAVAGVLLHG